MRREIGARGGVEGLKLIPRLGKRHIAPELGKDVADARREETRLEPGRDSKIMGQGMVMWG